MGSPGCPRQRPGLGPWGQGLLGVGVTRVQPVPPSSVHCKPELSSRSPESSSRPGAAVHGADTLSLLGQGQDFCRADSRTSLQSISIPLPLPVPWAFSPSLWTPRLAFPVRHCCLLGGCPGLGASDCNPRC